MYNLNNRMPVELRLTPNNRLHFDRPERMHAAISRLTNIDPTQRILHREIQLENQTLQAKRYSSWNLIHLLKRFFNIGVVVEQLGVKILIDVKEIRTKTGATDAQIAGLKRDQQLISFITISLAFKNLGVNKSADQIITDMLFRWSTPLTAKGTFLRYYYATEIPTGLSIAVNSTTSRVEIVFPPEPRAVEVIRHVPIHQDLLRSWTGQPNPETIFQRMPVAQPSTGLMNRHVVAVRLKSGALEQWERDSTLGKGSYGKVIRVRNQVGLFEGVKYARKRKGQRGVNDVQQEYDVHKKIFKNKKNGIWGFQRRIKEQIQITFRRKNAAAGENALRTVTANRTSIYSQGSYKATAEQHGNQFEQILPDFQQMMYTLRYMAKKGMSHNDIKPDNMFVDDQNGIRVVHLSDLAGVKFKDDSSTRVTYTKKYMPRGDRSIIQNSNLSPEIRRQARRKQDVFAMGVVMYKTMTGIMPYQVDFEHCPIPGTYQSINTLRPGAVPEEFDQLLSRMLDFDCNTRLDGTEAWNAFNTILAQYPEIQAQIAVNMQTLGFDPHDIV